MRALSDGVRKAKESLSGLYVVSKLASRTRSGSCLNFCVQVVASHKMVNAYGFERTASWKQGSVHLNKLRPAFVRRAVPTLGHGGINGRACSRIEETQQVSTGYSVGRSEYPAGGPAAREGSFADRCIRCRRRSWTATSWTRSMASGNRTWWSCRPGWTRPGSSRSCGGWRRSTSRSWCCSPNGGPQGLALDGSWPARLSCGRAGGVVRVRRCRRAGTGRRFRIRLPESKRHPP